MTAPLRFFVGLDSPSQAQHFERACISINRLRNRRGPFPARSWMMDSGAFTELSTHGHYRHDVATYAEAARRWIGCGDLQAIVAQDFMCEPWILARTGLSVAEHQRRTIERYDELLGHGLPVHVMPVLQGFAPSDYRRHLEAYGARFAPGAWVGVGSVCKRQGDPSTIVEVLAGIATDRPDLRLHGFGVKRTALKDGRVRALLHSADSMAWSFSARKQGRNQHDWREASRFVDEIEAAAAAPHKPWQMPMRLVGGLAA